MKKPLFIVAIIAFSSLIAKAGISDTTIYNGCQPHQPPTDNIGSSTQKYADICPEFPGGYSAFYKYLARNVHFPKGQEEVTGKVFVRIVIEKNGSVTNARVVHGLTAKLNKEALNAIEKSPKWRAAKFKGKPVRVYWYIPVSFKIEG